MITLYSLLFFIISLIFSRVILNSFFTPFVVYSGAWSLAGFLYGLNWIQYPEVSSIGWLGIFVAWIGLLIGSILGAYIVPNAPKYNRIISRKRLFKAMFITNLLVSLGLVWKIQLLISLFGSISNVNLTSLRVMLVQNSFYYPALSSYLTSLSLAAVVISMVYFFNFGMARGFVFVSLVLVVLSDWTFAGRAGIFISAFLVVSSFVIYQSVGVKKRLGVSKKSKMIMIVLSVSMLLSFSLYILSNREGSTDQYSLYKDSAAIAYVPELSGMYTYYTSNIVSLDTVLSGSTTFDQGKLLFAPFVSIISKITGSLPPDLYYPLINIPIPINTYSYIYEFYVGFGWVGVFLGPLFVGYTAQYFLNAFRVGKTYAIVPLILITTALAFSVSGNIFTRSSTIMSLVFALLVINWVAIKPKTIEEIEVKGA